MQTQSVQTLPGVDGLDGARTAVNILVRIARMLWLAGEERGRRRAIRELKRFDDKMLADIGIRRGDIERAVRYGRNEL